MPLFLRTVFSDFAADFAEAPTSTGMLKVAPLDNTTLIVCAVVAFPGTIVVPCANAGAMPSLPIFNSYIPPAKLTSISMSRYGLLTSLR